MALVARRRASIWLLAGLFGPVVLFIRTRRPQADNSYLWHVVAGRVQVETGSVLTTDPFSFTAGGEPWRTQSWLADLAYSWAHDVWGLESGIWIPPVVGGLVFLVLFAVARSRVEPGFGLALSMALSALVTLPFLNPRPVILSYLMLGLTVLALLHRKLVWALPLIAWLWATVHGSFVLAFVAIGLEWFRTRERRLLPTLAASVLTTQLTAHGLGLSSVLLEFLRGNAALERIQEWQPPDLLSAPLWPVLAGLFIVATAAGLGRLDWRTALVTAVWFCFGLTANRSIPVMWIGLLPVLASSASILDDRIPARATLPRPILTGVAIVLLAFPMLLPRERGLDEERFPVQAAEYLTEERVFHGDGAGGYLIYAYWPERLVYVDDRAELYHEHYVAFSDATRGGAEWLDEFDRWDIDQALVAVDQPITQILLAAGWNEAYRDDHFLVLDRPA